MREKKKWPFNLFFIGSDGAGNQFAVDLESPEKPIAIEFEDPESQFDPTNGWDIERKTISAWFNAVIKEMIADGYDFKTGKTSQSLAAPIFVIVGGLIVFGIIFFAISFGMKFSELLIDKLFG